MSLSDKFRNLFKQRAKHLHPRGAELGDWSAKGLTPEDLVDDEWIRQNTRRVQ